MNNKYPLIYSINSERTFNKESYSIDRSRASIESVEFYLRALNLTSYSINIDNSCKPLSFCSAPASVSVP